MKFKAEFFMSKHTCAECPFHSILFTQDKLEQCCGMNDNNPVKGIENCKLGIVEE